MSTYVKLWHDKESKAMVCIHPIHGEKYLNYAPSDTQRNRREAERLIGLRTGQTNLVFVWR